jgi:methyl-accepting chemotaxis protein
MSSITTEESNEALAVNIVRAIRASQATVEFDTQGLIIACNDEFSKMMGYTSEELVGKFHSDLVDPKLGATSDYSKFWDALRNGQSFSGEFERFAKNGRTVWLFSSYTPVLGLDGKVQRVIKIASDITASKETNITNSGIRNAIQRSMAVIEFTPDGIIERANKLFLSTMDCGDENIIGSHHKIFLNAEESQSQSYRNFWKRLASGEVISGQFERITKSGNSVWLEATYNPILNLNKEVFRVIKFETDITE